MKNAEVILDPLVIGPADWFALAVILNAAAMRREASQVATPKPQAKQESAWTGPPLSQE